MRIGNTAAWIGLVMGIFGGAACGNLVTVADFGAGASSGDSETDCTDAIDNDGDGFSDCADSDCADDPACLPPTETDCSDGLDNDADGLSDCEDPDCFAVPACLPETACDNGFDDDGDGAVDCDDPDCAGDPACGGSGWTCGEVLACVEGCSADMACIEACQQNGCDSAQAAAESLLDCVIASCLDSCAGDPGSPACQGCMTAECGAELSTCLADTCQGQVEIACHNGLDDDGDGAVDCDDPDCTGDPACGTGDWTCGEIVTCVQGCGADQGCLEACQQNGCDSAQALAASLMDCLMASCLNECLSDPGGPACQSCVMSQCGPELDACLADSCQGPVEIYCANGLDDDGDGLTDCADGDCLYDPACQGQVEIACTNGLDDDGDGLTDCADGDCAGDPACGGTQWTCSQILTCAQGCGGDWTCIDACRQNGCGTAQTYWDGLQSCLLQSCMAECMGDPTSPACQSCIAASCGSELGACLADSCQGGGSELSCANGVDDDGDGATDCADGDCTGDPACQGQVETACANGLDDDGDGATDCVDPDCAADQACTGSGWTCSQVLTCAEGCAGDLSCLMACESSGCPTAQSLYADFQSCLVNQCLAECVGNPSDPACQSCLAASCSAEIAACIADDCVGAGSETACADGADNDGDGAADCADSDCFGDPACQGQVELDCADNLDDDGDGAVDCADSDCQSDPACTGISCAEIIVCTQGCGWNIGCYFSCPQSGCPSAQAAYTDVRSCMFGSCLWPCLQDLQGPDCQSCMAQSCTAQLATCITDSC